MGIGLAGHAPNVSPASRTSTLSRRLRWAVVIFSLSLFITACGSDSPASDSPTSDTSSDTSQPTQSNYVWEMELEWSRLPEGDVGYPASAETATARLFLSPSDSPIWDEQKPEYVVTGGTVTYNPSYSDRFCKVEADTITFDIDPVEVSTSNITFDRTVTPNTYYGRIQIYGPEYVASFACRAGTGPDAPEGYQDPKDRTQSVSLMMLRIDREEPETVSGNGQVISGTWFREGTSRPSAIRETSYTLTRK